MAKAKALTTVETPTTVTGLAPAKPTDILPPRLATITTRHRELMHRLLLGEPLTHAAKECGFTYATARYITRSPLFRKELGRMQAELNLNLYDAAMELRSLQPDAIGALKEVANLTHRPDLRLAAAREILDRTGLGAKKTVQIDTTHQSISYEERLQIVQQGGELPPTTIEGFVETRILEGTELEETDVEG